MELKCPQCQAPVYSSKAAVCGRCEAPLPAQLVAVAAEHASALDRYERACREEAPIEEPRAPNKPKVDPFLMANLPPELLPDVVPRNYITEFKHRKRPSIKITVICTLAFAAVNLEFMPPNVALPFWKMAAIMAIFLPSYCYGVWKFSDPDCPKCARNVRTGRVDFCYGCGTKLRGRHCPECVVDYGWLGSTAGYLNSEYRQKLETRIRYCPGCGVELDTGIRRRTWGERL
jgi:hypothetical protein